MKGDFLQIRFWFSSNLVLLPSNSAFFKTCALDPAVAHIILRFLLLIAPALLLLSAAPALGQSAITVVTSFPKELTEAYKKAFEAKSPGTRLEFLNKNTTAGIAFVRETAAGSRPDVFWASAPDAFEVLAKDGLLTKYDGANKGVPAKIGAYPINDPEGFIMGRHWPATA